VRVEGALFTPVDTRDASMVRVGELVLAMGNP